MNYPIIIIITSILLQVTAAILALRLILVTRHIIAWTFIAAANLLMALRRCLTLYDWYFLSSPISSADMAAQIISVGTSVLMVVGVALITPLFLTIDRDKKQLIQSQQDFQLLVHNIPAIVFTGYNDGGVRFYDNKILEIAGYSREIFESKRIKWTDIVLAEDWTNAKKIFIEALRTDRAYVREYRIRHKNGQLVWLQERSRIVCGIQGNIDHISGVFFDINEKRQIESALNDTMVKLQETVKEVEQRNRYISLLNELGELLQACLTPQEAFQSITQVVPQLFHGLSGTMFIVNPRKSLLLEAATKWGDITHTEQLFTMDECWALRRGGVHIGKPGPYGLLCKHLSPGPSSDYMCVPLIAQGEILGLFYLQSTDHISSIDLDLNKQLAVTVAKQISMALANLNLRESLHIQAIVDPLTGLFNRRYMEETLEREIYRIRRRHSHIGVIMSDIDHFKRINDIYGHDAGDMVLTAIAGLFKKNIRREDIPCRYGGEEFLMILPDATQEDAYQRAEDLCRLVSELEIKHLGLSLGKITASFGVASCPAHCEKVADLIHAADSALYLAKERGRNQVVSAGRDNITEPTPDTDW